MRIIGGKFKGTRLSPPGNIKARPTTDFAREGLFNILQHSIDLDGLKVLDLFSGTGAVSMEFLSRGATFAVSVDSDPKAIRFLKSMSKQLQLENWKVMRANVFKLLDQHTSKYDIIFADPPFAMDRHEELVSKVIEGELLEEGGILIVEHSKKMDIENLIGFSSSRNYGNLTFSFFRQPKP